MSPTMSFSNDSFMNAPSALQRIEARSGAV